MLGTKTKKTLAERSFDLRTSGLWAQHASTAPLCYYFLTNLVDRINLGNGLQKVKLLSEVGFEPTPTEVDCDLNAAP